MGVTLPMPVRRGPARPRPTPGMVQAPTVKAGRDPSMGLLFAGYLAMIAIEYGGLAAHLPMLRTLHVSTILHWALPILVVVRGRRSDSLSARQLHLLLGLWALTALSVFYAEVQIRAFSLVEPILLSVAFAFITAQLFDRRSRIDKLAMVLVPVAMLLVWKNLGRMGTSRAGSLSAPYFMGDNNDFAWGLLVMLPLISILIFGQRRLVTRLFGLAGISACVVGIVYSQSRGGAIGLAVALLYGWLRVSKRRTLGIVVAFVVGAGVYLVAPPGYFERLETVATYEEDNSAQGRLEAWSKAIQMAIDYPLGVGAGNFPSAYGRHYLDVSTTRMTYAAGRWVNAHSIYFRVLGEYGFIGLIMLVWVLFACLKDNHASGRVFGRQAEAPVDSRWPALVNMGVLGFAVSGMFLGGFDYPHLFLLTGLTLAGKQMAAQAESTTPIQLTVPPEPVLPVPAPTAARLANWAARPR